MKSWAVLSLSVALIAAFVALSGWASPAVASFARLVVFAFLALAFLGLAADRYANA